MKKLEFTENYDYKLSPITGWTRKHWEEAFFVMMKGIIANASEGGARQRIPGQRSHHGLLADEMEGFSRTFIMAGPWLNQSKTGKFLYQGEEVDVAVFYRRGILAGADPDHPEYWGDIVDYAQHLVECAALAWSIYLSKQHVWDHYNETEKKQVAAYLFQCTKVKYHQNNWLLFNVITNTVLKKLGMPYSQEQIDQNIDACNHMYIGEGWYRDGDVNRIDYYNAWAFHYYYLQWVILDGDSKPELAATYQQRVREFARNFRYFFSGDGSTPCFGRSMIYRFGYLSPIVLGYYLNCLDIGPGEVRTMCNSGLKFFFDQEIFTDANHLSMGYIRPTAEITEHYSCGGSPYWAVKAFNLFLIPEDNELWKTKEAPLPIHKSDFSAPIKSAGFLLVGDHKTGHVQLINQKSHHDNPEYNAKYTKFAYSSVFSYEARPVYKSFNCDNVLQFSDDGINFEQRWAMEHLYCEKDFNASKYPLYKVDDNGLAYTYILVKDDFMINFHRIETEESLVFKEGGYPLGFDDGNAAVISVPGGEAAYKDGKLSFIRNLYGYQKQYKAAPFLDNVTGTNVRYRQSIVPKLEYENKGRNIFYLASMVYGKIGNDSIQQLMGLVKSFAVKDNVAEICFYDEERVLMQIGAVNDLTVTLNGKSIRGPIVVARVSADGGGYWLLDQAGAVDTNY